jgi:predicted permease
MRLTSSVFPTLGVEPLLGRVFTREEEAGNRQLAVISYATWINGFNRDASILGKSLDLDNRSYTIIGVMPRSFEFPIQPGHLNHTELWVPLSLTPDERAPANEGVWSYQMIGRLKDGVTVQHAASDVERVAQLVAANFPASMAAIRIHGDAAPLRDQIVGDVRPMLQTLFAAVAVVLLIACANVAGLLLVRAIRRRREYALRLALGATPARIVRESILEGLVLSTAAGILGLALAAACIRIAIQLLPDSMPRIDSIAIDWKVMAFALVSAVVTGILCSLAPAFAATKTQVIENLKQGSQSATGPGSHARLQSSLIVLEIAVALVLLTTSGAFLRSFEKMRAVNPGFQPEHVIVAEYQLPLTRYATFASADLFQRAIVDRLESKPQIAYAGLGTTVPASGFSALSAYTIEGVPASTWKLTFANFATVSGDYFKAMGIPLLAGRVFTRDDRDGTPLVIIVNASMANHCWPGQSPIGKRMHVGNPRKGYPWATVIGVVADTKIGPRDEPTGEQWYAPDAQPSTLFFVNAAATLTQPSSGFLIVRSTLPPAEATQTLRASVAEIDSSLALQNIQSMHEVMSTIEAPRRFNTGLITAFAIAALLLAITGIYAVVAFSVSQRTHEIAIRMAVGAQRTGVARLVIASATRLALLGCALGILGSLAVSHIVKAFLFSVSPTDPLIYAAGTTLMLLVALVAAAQPAIRAASTDPATALRSN